MVVSLVAVVEPHHMLAVALRHDLRFRADQLLLDAAYLQVTLREEYPLISDLQCSDAAV